ncbi:hypothetical protein ON010_g3406 [Phytophthora cinnamomi]|nr:hypothetical protein ON010_g3406 [Phytophthora cinnamomi]
MSQRLRRWRSTVEPARVHGALVREQQHVQAAQTRALPRVLAIYVRVASVGAQRFWSRPPQLWHCCRPCSGYGLGASAATTTTTTTAAAAAGGSAAASTTSTARSVVDVSEGGQRRVCGGGGVQRLDHFHQVRIAYRNPIPAKAFCLSPIRAVPLN